jgi:hypothetical protein
MKPRFGTVGFLLLMILAFTPTLVGPARATPCDIETYCALRSCEGCFFPYDFQINASTVTTRQFYTTAYIHCSNWPTGEGEHCFDFTMTGTVDVEAQIKYADAYGGAQFQLILDGKPLTPTSANTGVWGAPNPGPALGTLIGTNTFPLCAGAHHLLIREITMGRHDLQQCCDHDFLAKNVQIDFYLSPHSGGCGNCLVTLPSSETSAVTSDPHEMPNQALDPSAGAKLVCYPNPGAIGQGTVISLTGNGSLRDEPVSVGIYDLAGRLIWSRKARAPELFAGSLRWDGKDMQGNIVRNSILFCRVESPREILKTHFVRIAGSANVGPVASGRRFGPGVATNPGPINIDPDDGGAGGGGGGSPAHLSIDHIIQTLQPYLSHDASGITTLDHSNAQAHGVSQEIQAAGDRLVSISNQVVTGPITGTTGWDGSWLCDRVLEIMGMYDGQPPIPFDPCGTPQHPVPLNCPPWNCLRDLAPNQVWLFPTRDAAVAQLQASGFHEIPFFFRHPGMGGIDFARQTVVQVPSCAVYGLFRDEAQIRRCCENGWTFQIQFGEPDPESAAIPPIWPYELWPYYVLWYHCACEPPPVDCCTPS